MIAGSTGADLLVKFLKSQGVTQIFCITGAGNLAIVDAIFREGSINLTFSHHEQAAVMEAQGYSRVSGKPGVALVTTGGGTSNVVTGVLSSHLDSIPVFTISGNESSFHCDAMSDFRAYGVQGFDSVAVLEPICKKSARIMQSGGILSTLESLWLSMISSRQGPVHVDFPMDLQRAQIENHEEIVSVSYTPENVLNLTSEIALDKLILELSSAKRPVLYLGAGATSEKSIELISSLGKILNIPYFVSWSALDKFDDSDDRCFGRVGIYGDRFANILLQKTDLLLALGTRLSIPQVGYDRDDFGRNASKYVVDVDEVELRKNSGAKWTNINSTVEIFLDLLIQKLKLTDKGLADYKDWIDEGVSIRSTFPRINQIGPEVNPKGSYLHSATVMTYLNSKLSSDAIVVTDVGAALLTGHYILTPHGRQRLFTSQGLGEMGFGLPGAIGAHFADKNRQIVCLNTDGALMFNLQELQLISQESIPMKIFVFNNNGYSMIKISQENLFNKRYAGSNIDSGVTFPSFRKIAEAFDIHYTLADSSKPLHETVGLALDSQIAEFIEIRMDPEQKYLPRLATSRDKESKLVSPPLEDLDPKIDIDLLEEHLGYQAKQESYLARGI